jgi:CheY-like chemotaxis protein
MTKKILAIDDSLTLREFISRCLSKHSADYKVVLAKDGKEGLELAAIEQPNLILLDFILPDLKGDEVCRRLRSSPQTAALPIVLMSSSAADITRTQAEFDTVAKAIAKPFTPELLCATVGYVLRESAKKAAATATPTTTATEGLTTTVVRKPAAPPAQDRPEPSLKGHTGQFSLIAALLALEQDQCTGCFRIFINSEPVQLHLAAGRPVLATTRDVECYLQSAAQQFTPEQAKLLELLKPEQRKSGRPVFLQMAEHRFMPGSEAVRLCHETGLRLFAQAWTAQRAYFEFEALAEGPAGPADLPPYDGVMGDWAMETLRHVGDDFRSAMAWGEPTGIPAYTRRGYERIQQIPLNDEELAFASFITPTTSLAQIAERMKTDVEGAQRILHRFLCLEIFDYWPASLLRAA